MSSPNTISLASSRQFNTKHTQTRAELERTPIAQNISVSTLEQTNQEQMEKVTLSISAEQSIQITLLSKLFGKRIELPDLDMIAPTSKNDHSELEPVELSQLEGLEFVHITDHYYESEQTDFQAQGKLILSDGSTTDFSFSMSYHREFESYSELVVTQSELKDPLVINFSDQPMSLLNETFEFDLDLDGNKDNLSQLSSGTAFIALDKNKSGTIDDGSELFGAQTGNGFAELAQYDDDQNGLINKNDAIFDQLLVWHPGEHGELLRLADTEVDTLVLQTVNTPYRFTNNNNQTLGQMRQSSIYANQNGSVGGVHQIDLAV